MTTIRVRYTPNGTPTPGQISFQPAPDEGNHPIVSGRDILNGPAVWQEVPVEGAAIEVRPQDPGWHYVVRIRALGMPQKTATYLVPRDGTVDFESLVRYNPKAGLAYEPDPDWWAWVKEIRDLKGVPGDDGQDAYQVAVRNGYTGTESEWLASLEGPPGEGSPGPAGKTAYQVAVDAGFVGTEAEWLDSLRGPEGPMPTQLATTTTPGLMPAADKATVGSASAGFTVGSTSLVLRTSNGNANIADPTSLNHIANKRYVDDSVAVPRAPTDAGVAGHVSNSGSLTGEALRASFSLKDAVDARLYGLPTDGTSDCASALNAAAAAALAAGAPLYIPSGTYNIDSTVNLRYLSVHSAGTIVVRHENAIGVIIGHSAQFRPQLDINIREVVHTSYSTAQVDKPFPAIRLVGLKGSEVRIGRSSFMELYADDKVFEDNSLAYNTLRLGRINVLRINGVDTYSWINENLFLGGSFAQVHIEGLYPHNNNLWVKAAVEGTAATNPGIFISKGTHNHFQDVRMEGSVTVNFTGDASNNLVALLWAQHPDITGPTPAVVDVAGNNIVTTRFNQNHSTHTIARIDSDAQISSTKSEIRGMTRYPTASSTFKKLDVPTGWGILGDFTIPIEDPLAPTASANQTQFPRSRMVSFILRSDVSFLRPRVYGLDVDGNLIDPAVTPFLSGWGITVVSNYYSKSSNSSFMPLRVTNPNVKYLRFALYAEGPATFKHVTLTAHLPSSHDRGVVDQAIRAAHNPYTLA